MSRTSWWNTAAAATIPHGLPLPAVLAQDLASVLHHEVIAAIVVDMDHAVRCRQARSGQQYTASRPARQLG
eukprot:8714418-Pyramimonas_sp.AAC.1